MVGAEDPQLQLQAADTRTEATNTDDDLSQGKATLGYQLNSSDQSRPDDKQQTNTRRNVFAKACRSVGRVYKIVRCGLEGID